MDKRSTSILLIVLASLLCGLPGLAGLCIGPLAIIGSSLPDSGLAQEDARMALISGVVLVFFSLVLIGIPLVTVVFTRRRKKEKLSVTAGTIPEDDF
jgi:hypothetical protein